MTDRRQGYDTDAAINIGRTRTASNQEAFCDRRILLRCLAKAFRGSITKGFHQRGSKLLRDCGKTAEIIRLADLEQHPGWGAIVADALMVRLWWLPEQSFLVL